MSTKTLKYILPLVLLLGCIKQYTPNIEINAASKVVVSGKLTNIEGYQTILLSKSTPLDKDSKYQPLRYCMISIWDEMGNEYEMYEYEPGEYKVWMNSDNLKIGTAYYLQIRTPEGEELKSEPDIMTAVAPASLPKYKIDSIYNSVYKSYAKGLQFAVDINGDESTSKYYLFELVSTYEHHANYAREWYYDGWGVHHIYPPDSSLMYCWTTERVPEVLTLSTENLVANEFNNFNLHFVTFYNNEKLSIGYSLLLRQFGLSKNAFIYWESVRLNNNGFASLYNKQPVDTKGNITNLTYPEKEVLGFFSASAISESRIFVNPQPTITFEQCFPQELEGRAGGFNQISHTKYPAFLLAGPDGTYEMMYLPENCVNCAAYNGTPFKPEFWPY